MSHETNALATHPRYHLPYTLLKGLRRLGLEGTKYAQAQADTLRLKLVKVAARVRVTARRVVFHLASSYPLRDLFSTLCQQLLQPN